VLYSFVIYNVDADHCEAEYLTGIVTDLFVDWNKLKGVDSRHQIADMTRIIMSPQAKFDDLLAMFTSKSTLRGHK
jgi:hypothetical protein